MGAPFLGVGAGKRGLSDPRPPQMNFSKAPLLSKGERCRLSQVSTLCMLCSCLSTSGWWGGHPVNTYPVGTRFTICALPVLLSIYKRVLVRASFEHLSGGDPLWYTTYALHALLSIYKREMGRSSHEHLSDGDPLWCTTCALHA